MKILLTGGSGALGSNIKKMIDCFAPSSDELDITDEKRCLDVVNESGPDIIIHCAAYTDVAKAEADRDRCWVVNVVGTQNMVRAANGARFIYISTHYVFDGERGNYTEEDTPKPINYYSLTKLIGEAIVNQYPNTLIIRTGFKKDGEWEYPKAFIDQWTCADYASERAPDIVKASIMKDLTGIIHISGSKKSIYELARRRAPTVGQMSIKDVAVKLPGKIYLNSDKWTKLLKSKSAEK
ncbi:MAG: dTDP-4-rhamnose reductase-related protein [Candidatus Moranbacteria bacterium GW2011_GWF2_35_39]|nr:MAG: dTDP-4-rhamnose reductase-related protein [Candidatus Moranbacteria bacterium GW2011_GWF2_35_39]